MRRDGCRWAALIVLMLCGAGRALAADTAPTDPAACRTVGLSDIGWTDVTATTATLAALLTRLGYTPKIRLLSLPVTYMAMQRGDLDVFLGDWEPSGKPVIAPFLAGPGRPDGVVRFGPNLVGARYTLAVPDYAFAAGLDDFGKIAAFSRVLHRRIYGIEPGNDGNQLVLRMIADDRYGLGDFHLVESSEAGMLAQVRRELAIHVPIVFLAWEPHPMNLLFPLRYLAGGDAVFGPDFGAGTVNTITRPGYATACPNVARLLRQLRFEPGEESEMMSRILTAHQAPDAVGQRFLDTHPDQVAQWLKDVTDVAGHPAQAAAAGPHG